MNILYLLVTVLFLGDACNCVKYVSQSKRQNNNNQKITRIIGGEVATSAIPYQVSIQKFYQNINQWRHTCGGSIIGNSHILTAAHCTSGKSAKELSVVVGTTNLKYGGFRHYAKSYVQHELYSNKGSAVYNDVAVIKVSAPFTFGSNIAPISLAENFDTRMENDYPVTLTGWGVTDMYSQKYLPDSLMILNYTTISNEDCKAKGFQQITANEVCALYGRSRGSCLGDSGGPLVNRERNIQIGLVSYGSRFCANNKPDVYVRIPKFIPWIQKAVTDLIP